MNLDNSEQLAGIKVLREIESSFLSENIGSRENILELRVGTNPYSDVYSSKECNVHGVDVSRKVLDKAKSKKSNGGGCFLYLADAKKLPFKDCSFDVVVAMGSGAVLRSRAPVKIMDEVHRVLKDRGLLLLTLSNRDAPLSKAVKYFIDRIKSVKSSSKGFSLKEVRRLLIRFDILSFYTALPLFPSFFNESTIKVKLPDPIIKYVQSLKSKECYSRFFVVARKSDSIDFSKCHDGSVFLTHRWQKHIYRTSNGSIIVPVYEVKRGGGVTHIYRNFEFVTTLSSSKGDVNAGIIVEDNHGCLYATGHSNPKKLRTNILYCSCDDGKTWYILSDLTNQSTDDPPHPHNLYFDNKSGCLWWLIGHNGKRLLRYRPAVDKWEDMYSDTIIEEENRNPSSINRINNYLWLTCEVSGPDKKQLFYSKDGGNSWEKVNHEFSNPKGAKNDALWNICSDSKGTLFVSGGRINTGQSFVKKSDDNGKSWELIYSGKNNSDAWLTIIDDILFIADENRLFLSLDGGYTIKLFYTDKHVESRNRKLVEPGIKKLGNDWWLIENKKLRKLKSYDYFA